MKTTPIPFHRPFAFLAILIVWFVSGCSTAPLVQPEPFIPAIPTTVIPAVPSGQVAEMRQDIYHEVAPMETVWRIGKIYNVDQQAIVQANHLADPTQIAVGQRLLIPKARTPRAIIPLYDVRQWTHIVVHHTATHQGNALTIGAFHDRKGWGGLGYHFLIGNGTSGNMTGMIEVGPRWIKQQDGAHCNAAGMNQRGIGIALVGNFSKTGVSRQQLDALVFLVNILRQHYNIPVSHILPHRDVPGKNTECPGKHFPWKEFISRLSRTSQQS